MVLLSLFFLFLFFFFLYSSFKRIFWSLNRSPKHTIEVLITVKTIQYNSVVPGYCKLITQSFYFSKSLLKGTERKEMFISNVFRLTKVMSKNSFPGLMK